MFKTLVLSTLFLCVTSLKPSLSLAQTSVPLRQVIPDNQVTKTLDQTQASEAGTLSSPSAEVVQKVKEKQDKDITLPESEKKDALTLFLEKTPPGPLSWNNFLQHAIRWAVTKGVPANTITLVLLFPLIAMLIAASRHIIGLRGFGIYIPAVLSVAFVSTGIINGVIIFTIIILVTMLAKKLLKKVTMPYLPRTALVLWAVSVGILGLLLVSPLLPLSTLMAVSIFPILILILLSENFLEAQASAKPIQALTLTLETIFLASVAALILNFTWIQELVLWRPELTLLVVALISILVGRYTGLRFTERIRFKDIIEE